MSPKVYRAKRDLVRVYTGPGESKLVDSVRAAFMVETGVGSYEEPPVSPAPAADRRGAHRWLKKSREEEEDVG